MTKIQNFTRNKIYSKHVFQKWDETLYGLIQGLWADLVIRAALVMWVDSEIWADLIIWVDIVKWVDIVIRRDILGNFWKFM